jgi:hypothetical protein
MSSITKQNSSIHTTNPKAKARTSLTGKLNRTQLQLREFIIQISNPPISKMSSLAYLARSADGKKLLNSKKSDISVAEYGNSEILLRVVPKQMLAHFCGWEHISPLLRHTDEGKQELRLKKKYCEPLGLKIVVDWMQRACKDPKIDFLKAPVNDIIAACAIQRALRVLGCYTDADRLNYFIQLHYFRRPLNAQKVAKLVEAFPIDSIHIEWMVTNVHYSLTDGWVNEVLPASFKRNLRAVIKKNEALQAKFEPHVTDGCTDVVVADEDGGQDGYCVYDVQAAQKEEDVDWVKVDSSDLAGTLGALHIAEHSASSF